MARQLSARGVINAKWNPSKDNHHFGQQEIRLDGDAYKDDSIPREVVEILNESAQLLGKNNATFAPQGKGVFRDFYIRTDKQVLQHARGLTVVSSNVPSDTSGALVKSLTATSSNESSDTSLSSAHLPGRPRRQTDLQQQLGAPFAARHP